MRIILFLLSLYSSDLYSGCISGNCQSGEGKYRFKQGVYQGSFEKGQPNGRGLFHFNNGQYYKGDFKNGIINGLGKLTYSYDSYYIGDFIKGQRHGKGKMIYEDGSIYKGHWKNNKRNGSGKYILVSGEIIEGLWLNDKIETKANQQRNKTYKDCINNFCNNEVGIYTYRDGSKYIGNFINGFPDGQGRCEYKNGDVYIGDWKNHAPHGNGTFTLTSGKVIRGEFDNGRLISNFQNTSPVKDQAKKRTNSNSNNKSEIYAVVVGVASYNHMPSLKYTDDDAYQLYALLKSPNGGALPDKNVSILIDDAATSSNITNKINETFLKADENDVILVYMSGHGLKGSFVPYDFDGTNNLLGYDKILNALYDSKAKNKLFITDACHSGSMLQVKSGWSSQLNNYYQNIGNSKGGLAIISSSKANEVSLEYSGMRQGIFSHYLIKGLKGEANINNDKIIDVSELYTYINHNVKKYTNNAQSPVISGDYEKRMPVAMVYDD